MLQLGGLGTYQSNNGGPGCDIQRCTQILATEGEVPSDKHSANGSANDIISLQGKLGLLSEQVEENLDCKCWVKLQLK